MPAKPLAIIALAACFAAACRPPPEPVAATADRPMLGVMTTLPLLWAEAADIGELLTTEGEAGWVRGELETRFKLEPLDTLDETSLAGLEHLILAQPRALSPAENVALDGWVRRGGRLLLFADPMLTQHSRYPVGDRRRPQDVALLSPILAHWGLELTFAAAQGEGEQMVAIEGAGIPVNLAGSFRLMPGSRCSLQADGLLARCRIGKGAVVALADAAVLDEADDDPPAPRRAALGSLVAFAFD